MNPFISIWSHPKQTARYVIENKTILYSLFIVLIGSMASGLTMFQDAGTYPDVPYFWILLTVLFGAPILNFIVYFISAGISFLIGKLLKGKGSFTEVLQAVSLTYIPQLYLLPFYIIWLLLFTESYFLTEVSNGYSIFMAILTAVSTIWMIVINVAVLSEAHQFSIWRAIITIIIPAILFISFFVVIIVAIVAAVMAI